MTRKKRNAHLSAGVNPKMLSSGGYDNYRDELTLGQQEIHSIATDLRRTGRRNWA